MMNETVRTHTRLARKCIYKMLNDMLPDVGTDNNKLDEAESLLQDAVLYTKQADLLAQKYYIDVRDMSAWIVTHYGHVELRKLMRMYNEYRNQ
jgi:hypothetical protein